MKSGTKFKSSFLLIIFLIIISSIQIVGREIVNNKYSYKFKENLFKVSNTEYLSEIITIPLKNADPFIAIGFNANLNESQSTIDFYIRVSVDGNDWSDWQEIKEGENSERENKKFLSSLYFFEKENKFIQFKTSSRNSLSELTFSFISPDRTPIGQINENLRISKLEKQVNGENSPSFVDRKSWGCPQAEHVNSRSLTDVTHLIIHHSAGNTVSNDFAAVVLSYWSYHVNSNGWDDIGYNWLVDPNGVLYKGRAWKSETEENVMGAHNSGKNSNTSGICFIGNYVSSIPSEIGLDKIAELSAFLCDKYGIDPVGSSYHAAIEKVNDNIDGHGQSGGGTACPGTQLINRLQVIRDKTFNYKWDTSMAPEIVSTFPLNEQDSAYLTKEIKIEFTHPMNQESVKNAFAISPNFVGTISWNTVGNVLLYKPLVPFEPQTNYNITIFKQATSIWDVGLNADYRFSFVTKTNDNLSLIETSPENGEIDIARELTIELKFDGPIDGTSLGGNISFIDEDSNAVAVSVNNKDYPIGIIRFSPNNLLEENSSYHIILREGIATTDGYTFGIKKTITFQTENITTVKNIDIPNNYNLISVYPNPFNPTTTFEVHLKQSSKVLIKVYDIIGKQVAAIGNKEYSEGKHKIYFDAGNLQSGIYFAQIITNNQNKSIKLVLLK